MIRKVLLVAALSMVAGSAFAACPNPLVIKDGNGSLQNFSSATAPDGGCQYNVTSTSTLSTSVITIPASAATDGWDVTQGTKGDAPWSGSGSGSLISILKALWAAVTSPIPSGTNTIGSVSVVLSSNVAIPLGTSGGWTPKIVNNLLSPVVSIKASAGQLGKLYCYNPNASVAYVQTFNISPVTLGVTASAASYGLGATSASGFIMPVQGDQYNTSISVAATTTATGSTAPGTGVDCNVSFN